MRAYTILSLFVLLWMSFETTALPVPDDRSPWKKHTDEEVKKFGSEIKKYENIAKGLGVPLDEVPDDLTEKEKNYWEKKGENMGKKQGKDKSDNDKDKPTEFQSEPKKDKSLWDKFWGGFKGASESLVEWEHENLKFPSSSPDADGAGVLGGLPALLPIIART